MAVKRVTAARRALRKARRASQDITADLMPPRTFLVTVTVPAEQWLRLVGDLHPAVLERAAEPDQLALNIDATREPIALRLAARAVERLGGTVLHTETRPR